MKKWMIAMSACVLGMAAIAQSSAPAGGVRALAGHRFVDAAGTKLGAEALEGKKVVLFYFSASWCPPCRAFTPKLIDAYKQWKKDNLPVEVVLVSSDRDEKAMLEYLKGHGMPWIALPFRSEEGRKLSEANGVRGIPTLVVYGADGRVITKDGRGAVSAQGADAIKDWLK